MTSYLLVIRASSFVLRWFGVSCPAVFLPVERKNDSGFFECGFDMDGTLPELVEVREGVLGVVGLQLDAAEAVLQEQLAAVFVVGVFHVNDRPADVCEIKQQPLL